jgi:hypothetical protein
MVDVDDNYNDANRHQTIQFGHYHRTPSLVLIITLQGIPEKIKLKRAETMRI